MPVDQLGSLLDVRFFSMCYYTWPGVSILVRKNRFVMNWYIFLGCDYGIFNGTVNHLITLKTLKKQNFAPDPKLQLRLLCNRFVSL